MTKDREIFEGSLWSALTPSAPLGGPPGEDIKTDVAIVGGGFLGLSTALHLAEAGVEATVLEAEEVGFGASGRNTGFVVPSLKSALGPADLARFLGASHMDKYVRLIAGSGDEVFSLIRRFGIDCDAEQTGWFQPAHSAAMARVLEQRVRDWSGHGARVEMISAEETGRRTGVAGYHGAVFVPSGGQVNPLAYVRGLARAASAAGARIHERSKVQRIERVPTGWLVAAAGQVIHAGRVLLATNAMIGSLQPDIAVSMVPATVYQVATDVLAPEHRARILPERAPLADTRRHTLAVRWSPDGRLMSGGLVFPGPAALGRASRFFARRLSTFFPQLGNVEISYVWRGVISMTFDSLPRFVSLAPGLEAAFGCNGRGIALTTALGRRIAGRLSGCEPESDFPLPVTEARPVPGRQLSRIGPMLYLPWSEALDWFESRSTR
jgi:glycine/D-amino acid oxidase-like deaminating enzyme